MRGGAALLVLENLSMELRRTGESSMGAEVSVHALALDCCFECAYFRSIDYRAFYWQDS